MLAARRLTRRPGRARSGAFLAEGPLAVAEALADPRRPVRELFVTPDAGVAHPDLLAAAGPGVAVATVSEPVMRALSQTMTPPGVVAVVSAVDVPLRSLLRPGCALVAVLAGIRDPGNAGTVLRSADAAGADAVVFTADSVDPYNAKAVRASAGSLFHVPFSLGVPLAEAIAAVRDAGCAVLAADAAGQASLFDLRLAGPIGWLFGGESGGLPEAARSLADETVRVPMYGRAESLNLAAAAAICLYATARAHLH